MSNNVSRLIQFVGQEVVAGRMLGDGISMTEAEFGEEFKVSRNVIREVVKVLISKGIIKSRQRIGIHRENVENWNWFDYDVFSWVARENASGRVMRSFFESRVIMQGDAAALSAQKFDSFHVHSIPKF